MMAAMVLVFCAAWIGLSLILVRIVESRQERRPKDGRCPLCIGIVDSALLGGKLIERCSSCGAQWEAEVTP